MNHSLSYSDLQQLVQQDPLSGKRQAFLLPEDTLYLDGNSLGAMPKAAADRAQQVLLTQWAADLIKSWNSHNWIDLPLHVGNKIGRLIGAADGQVICCDSTSINLFKVLELKVINKFSDIQCDPECKAKLVLC